MKNTRYDNVVTFLFVYSPAMSESSTSLNHFEKVVSYTRDELAAPPKATPLKPADPVLPQEDRGQFEKLLQRLKSELMPASVHEDFLVAQMAAAQWKLKRLERIEKAMLEALEGTEDAFPDKKKITGFARIERYRKTLEQNYRRSANELRAGRKRQSR